MKKIIEIINWVRNKQIIEEQAREDEIQYTTLLTEKEKLSKENNTLKKDLSNQTNLKEKYYKEYRKYKKKSDELIKEKVK